MYQHNPKLDLLLLTKPVEDRPGAHAFIKMLIDADCMFHFDDDPASLVVDIFPEEYLDSVRRRVDELYELDWKEFECPIGYVLHLEGHDMNA